MCTKISNSWRPVNEYFIVCFLLNNTQKYLKEIAVEENFNLSTLQFISLLFEALPCTGCFTTFMGAHSLIVELDNIECHLVECLAFS